MLLASCHALFLAQPCPLQPWCFREIGRCHKSERGHVARQLSNVLIPCQDGADGDVPASMRTNTTEITMRTPTKSSTGVEFMNADNRSRGVRSAGSWKYIGLGRL